MSNSIRDLPELEFHSETTVWNFHRCGGLIAVGYNKKSNIYKKLEEIRATGYKGCVTFNIKSIGRSGHSASKVEVFLGCVDVSLHGSAYFSNRNAEFFIS